MRKLPLCMVIAGFGALSTAHAQGLRGLEMDVMDAGESPGEATARIALPGPAAAIREAGTENAVLATDPAPRGGEAAALDTGRAAPESMSEVAADTGQSVDVDDTVTVPDGQVVDAEPIGGGGIDGSPPDVGSEPGGGIDDVPFEEPPVDVPPIDEPPVDVPPVEPPPVDVPDGDTPIGSEPGGSVVPGDEGGSSDAVGGSEPGASEGR